MGEVGRKWAYYNENDPKTAAWLRELIKAKLIADGEVDTRSIVEVQPSDLLGFRQCHFFAGIGGWSYALRLAGWGDDRECWTGSCPCQPFSSAGRGDGADDPRHLWPTWFRLIRECAPRIIFGEQVASIDGLAWIDLVHTDLEATAYAIGAVDLCAASVGAPHVRQRLYFVAESEGARGRADTGAVRGGTAAGLRSAQGPNERRAGREARRVSDSSANGNVGNPKSAERETRDVLSLRTETRSRQLAQSGVSGDVAHADARGQRINGDAAGHSAEGGEPYADEHGTPSVLADANGGQPGDRDVQRSGRHDEQSENTPVGVWDAVEWLPCTDGKARPVEPGTFPLAHGLPARVGRLRGYGNAIVPQVAAEVIAAYMEICE